MDKKIRDSDEYPSFKGYDGSDEIDYWYPSKTHSIDVDSAVYQEITELLEETGMSVEELLLDLVLKSSFE